MPSATEPVRGHPRRAAVALALALASACVFVPPPALPEEIAAKQAAEEARLAAARGAKEKEEGGGAKADGEAPRFSPGDEPELGMSEDERRAYAIAQGDPEGGVFTLEEALADLERKPELWARFVVKNGTLDCRLLSDAAPVTVANFVGLARGIRPVRDSETGTWVKRPYYDGTGFHRVIAGFMIQGGDPSGTGTGNAGYVIPDEFVPDLRHDRPGILSMANRGPTTGSAQFFITLAPTPHLDGKHTIFGECTDASVELAEAIAQTGDSSDRPDPPAIIERVEILSK